MEAEKLWDIFDKENGYPFKSKRSREAYKSQLKKSIEEEITKIRSDKYHSSYDLKAIQTLEKTLELIDQVKPPQQ